MKSLNQLINENLDKLTDAGPQFEEVFKLNLLKIFCVSYHRVGSNKYCDFSTKGTILTKNKKSYQISGQCQNNLFENPGEFKEAEEFYKKWDKKHLHSLSKAEYDELIEDLKVLEKVYKFKKFIETSKRNDLEVLRNVDFEDEVEVSKMK